MKNAINSWKNNNVFKKQLSLNLKELSTKNNYPNHWFVFIKLINDINPKSILDIGCGCGAYYALCSREFQNIKYTGIDYSKEAIDLAKESWKYSDFFVKDYKELTKEDIKNYDVIHLGALLDVLPNGDEAFEFILNLGAKNIIIGRVKLTDKDSFYETYIAYDEIITYSYHHNKRKFIDLYTKYNYVLIGEINNNFHLKLNN